MQRHFVSQGRFLGEQGEVVGPLRREAGRARAAQDVLGSVADIGNANRRPVLKQWLQEQGVVGARCERVAEVAPEEGANLQIGRHGPAQAADSFAPSSGPLRDHRAERIRPVDGDGRGKVPDRVITAERLEDSR